MPAPRKWTDADNSYLRKVWTDPAVHRDDIVKRLGKTIDTVRMQAKRLGLGGRPRGKNKNEWPHAVATRAETLWREGKSAAEIGKLISTKERTYSRLAVIGFISREGLTRNEPKASNPGPRPKPKPKPEKVFKVGQGNVVFVQSPQVAPVSPARAEAFKPIAGSFPRPWTERPSNGCKWPLMVDGVEGMSCCEPVERRGYCGVHAQAAFAPTGSAKELMRGLRRVL